MKQLVEKWRAAWPEALSVWSSFAKLSEPRFCLTEAEEKKEGLRGSFAMIRLLDHAVVVSLRQIAGLGLEEFAVEILAHEVGHHIFAPGDLRDNALLQTYTRSALVGFEHEAAMVANLYTDLLINDRLQRDKGLNMAGIYGALREPTWSGLWIFYLHTYEILWGLETGTLFDGELDEETRIDAVLASRLIRSYAGDWLGGAAGFAAICARYLQELQAEQVRALLIPFLDAAEAGAGSEAPDGFASLMPGEVEEAVHPAVEPSAPEAGSRAQLGGQKNVPRDPKDYAELMQSLGVELEPAELTTRYYRELARPYRLEFLEGAKAPAKELQAEGVEVWELGAPISAIDWVATAVRSPVVIPGVTTMQRVYGEVPGQEPDWTPPDLYLGVDCSGSMANPATTISYPVLAGTVVAMSAIRQGARVKTVLSGEPGEFVSTEGYSTDLEENLRVLTGYLGMGYTFGLGRLDEEFVQGPRLDRPVHLLLMTDTDIFQMLEAYPQGWEVARAAAERCGGGASCVFDNYFDWGNWPFDRLREAGWDIYFTRNEEELLRFAMEFSRQKFAEER